GADCLLILTEWDQFRALDLARVKSMMHRPLVVDLRNIYRPAEMRAHGFRYISVGRREDLFSDMTPEAMREAFDWGPDVGRENVPD
ncbi:MAG TPA: UDP-glucose/GDP-mannose dehydrogenase family protein, partial [Caulobacteraceae bacterium]|nr:UDP-glucose/GDP-mannose dehydrogenase family protein [Caulobacteraceae bacterium]